MPSLPVRANIVVQFEPEDSLPLILVFPVEKQSLATPARLRCSLTPWSTRASLGSVVVCPAIAGSASSGADKIVATLRIRDSEVSLQVFDEKPQRWNILECNSPEDKKCRVAHHQAFDKTPNYQNLTLGDEDTRVHKGWVEVATIFKGGTYLGRFEELKVVGKKNL